MLFRLRNEKEQLAHTGGPLTCASKRARHLSTAPLHLLCVCVCASLKAGAHLSEAKTIYHKRRTAQLVQHAQNALPSLVKDY